MEVRRIPNSESELTHHGIKGQKWGVMHGPPYPLKASLSDTRYDGNSNKSTKKYLSKMSNSAVKKYEKTYNKLNKKIEKETNDLKKVEDKYYKKYEKAKNDKQRAKINKKYAPKINKEWEEKAKVEYALQKEHTKSIELITASARLTPNDVSAEKKYAAKAIIKEIVLSAIPVVSTIRTSNRLKNDIEQHKIDTSNYNAYKYNTYSKNKE